ncbi:MAG TPA: DUF1302 family protein [Candidatus Binatia bacterium]|nr:DUF1302 family protein [Candidatus Binatia bacterium]
MRTGRGQLLLALLVVAAPRLASATQKFGPIQLSGNLQTQNLFRHPDAGTYQFIQNRNVAHLSLEYKWLERGKLGGRYAIPFIDRSDLVVHYRGVYDSIYDTTPGFSEREDVHGRAYSGKTVYEFARTVRGLPRSALTVSGLPRSERDAYKFENTLREAYVDLAFRDLPLRVRAGRQQVVWGESDNFRMLDRANTLDLTWHFVQELPPPAFGWDELRRPFWMLKFNYNLGDVWKLWQTFLEWYWNPGDWYPAKIAFLPRPWGVRFFDPFTNPVDGAFFRGICESAPGRRCTGLMDGTRLFRQGDYERNPLENSQVGVRFHAITPQAIEFTLNYFYQRWGGDDGSPSAPIRALTRTRANGERTFGPGGLLQRGILPIEYIAPYVHTIGASANYSDEQWTGAVYRFETVYDVGIPMFDVAKAAVIDVPAIPGVTKKNMWKGMLGFDRPTWIRSLNKKTTFFFTGQLFWHHVVNNPSCAPGRVADVPPDPVTGRRGIDSCLLGPLDLPSAVRTNNPTLGKFAFRDKVRDWETLVTFAGFTFYRGGSLLPVAGLALDPVNKFGMEAFWMLDYTIRDDLVVNLTQRYFITPYGHSEPIFDPWGFASMSAGRSETSLRFTYQF